MKKIIILVIVLTVPVIISGFYIAGNFLVASLNTPFVQLENGDVDGFLHTIKWRPDKYDYPLHLAAELNHIEVIKVLLDDGADINEIDDEGSSPLIVAIIFQSFDAAEYLIKQGADVNIVEKSGRNALSYSSSKEIKELLLERGAKPGKELILPQK